MPGDLCRGWQVAQLTSAAAKDYFKAVPVLLRSAKEERETRLHVSIASVPSKAPAQAARVIFEDSASTFRALWQTRAFA